MSVKYLELNTPFELESGKQLEKVTIAYHTYGKLNTHKNNVVWVFHALTANSNVMEWWPGLFGEHDLFNPEEYFIVCANVLGSPYGSTVPTDLNFPFFTVRDVVGTQLLLAKELKIDKIHIAIGGSFGGNQALEFAYSFSGIIDKLLLVACAAKESAWGIAIHEAQRLALQGDVTFGQENGGQAGLKAARAVALLTYRTSSAYIAQQTDTDDRKDDFKAASYIRYQGEKLVKRFNALSFHYLTKCLDTHHIGRGRGGEIAALQKIRPQTLVIGVSTDFLIPTHLSKFMAKHIPGAIYKEIDSEFGHDGFLVETDKLTNEISSFLKK